MTHISLSYLVNAIQSKCRGKNYHSYKKANLEKNIDAQVFQAVKKVESIAEKSEAESGQVLAEVRSEFERLGNVHSEERRQMLEHIQSESEANNQRTDKVCKTVSFLIAVEMQNKLGIAVILGYIL